MKMIQAIELGDGEKRFERVAHQENTTIT